MPNTYTAPDEALMLLKAETLQKLAEYLPFDETQAAARAIVAEMIPADPSPLTPIEAALLTPPHVNTQGRINLADWLFAQGHRDLELDAIVSPFTLALLALLDERESTRPRLVRVIDSEPTRAYNWQDKHLPLIERLYRDEMPDILHDLGYSERLPQVKAA